jgi:hypothetical protein
MNGVESAPPRNGFWWLGLDRLERIMFIQGYVDGLARADKLIQIEISIKALTIPNNGSPESVTQSFDFYRVAFGQLGDGLDTFYGDFRNKRILFDYAALYVRDQIRGVSSKELEIRIENMRKATTEENYDQR